VCKSNHPLQSTKITLDNPQQLSVIRKFDEIYQQQHRYLNEQQQQSSSFNHNHYLKQNRSFRITNTFVRESFLRAQETNSFRIPQGDWHERR
jgi:hypothetical protein